MLHSWLNMCPLIIQKKIEGTQSALKVENRYDIRVFDFSNWESTCDLADFPASNYGRKTAARRFDTIHDIRRFPRPAQSLLKDRNTRI